ncbi:helix-turn-helix domain-containing protein, partial [Streptomyces sp. NPDC005568]|uniref:helix-turn-helix domain-containing protein n=1 Tax=Streptomyces sp. NPDC005568 TaxID=3156887 RepID=UPI0033BC6E9D
MTSQAPTPAYRRLSVEERRSQLLDAALSLFAHRAPEEVSLDDVAEAAGVSRPLVYRYFPGGTLAEGNLVNRIEVDKETEAFAKLA